MQLIQQMLGRYSLQTHDDYTRAFREIMQEIALAGLYRAGFFKKAAFYGGTCLRIFHGLDRFSEDMDFSLLRPDPGFSFDPYLDSVKKEFYSHGMEITIKSKPKNKPSQVESAFFKNNTSIYDFLLDRDPLRMHPGQPSKIKIKFETDTDPPPGFTTENKLMLLPFSFYVGCYSLPDLFAGKMHALLFRRWKTRVKGRDWYDLEWYIRQGIAVHLNHLSERISQSGDLPDHQLNAEGLLGLLKEHIAGLDVSQAISDIKPFVRDKEKLTIWSNAYFLDLITHLKVME